MMALMCCQSCTTRYAVGLNSCPHCGSADVVADTVGGMLPAIEVTCGSSGCPAAGQRRMVRLLPAGTGLLMVPRVVCASCGCEPAVTRRWRYPIEGKDDVAKISRLGGPSDKHTPTPGPATAADSTVDVVDVDTPTADPMPDPPIAEPPAVDLADTAEPTPAAGEEPYEADEPLNEIVGVFEHGEKHVTRVPDPPATTAEPTPATEPAAVTEEGDLSSPGSSSSTSPTRPQPNSEPNRPASRRRARTTANPSKPAQTADSTARSTGGCPAEATSPPTDDAGVS